MTVKEAIKTLEHYLDYWKQISDEEGFPIDDDVKAMEMAIEALKEQKTSQLITNGIGVRYCSNCRRIDNKYSVYER